MTAAEAFDFVTKGGANDFEEVARLLAPHTPWCLIGGLAVNCYVEPVYTLDADIVVVASVLPKIETALRDAGFTIRSFPNSLNARRRDSQLSIQFTTDPRYQPFVEDTRVMPVLGVPVPVASLEKIVQGKIWAWRDPARRATKRKKDELDLLRIAETHEALRPLIPAEILAQL